MAKLITQTHKTVRFLFANIMAIVLMTLSYSVYAKQSTNMSASYLMKVDKYYSECMSKTEGITSEMLNCATIATDKLDKYLWPYKNRKIMQIEVRKKFIKDNDLLCTKVSSSYDGTSWSVAYSDCIYQQFVKKIQTKL